MKRWSGMAPWLAVTAVVLVLDRITKLMAESWLDLHVPLAVVPGLNLTLTYNTGAAFSFLSQAGGWQRWLFSGFAIVISGILVTWLYRLPRADRWLAAALALVLAGALGNLWDRLAYGYVIDYIDFYYKYWHWPAFNVADAAITTGAVMLIIDAIWLSHDDKKRGGYPGNRD